VLGKALYAHPEQAYKVVLLIHWQFINTLLGYSRMRVGHDITSCTSKLEHEVIDPIPNRPKLKGHRIVIVDTPGFDDT